MRPRDSSVITVTIILAGITLVTDFLVFCPKTLTTIIFYTQYSPFNVRVNGLGLFHLEVPCNETRGNFLEYLLT